MAALPSSPPSGAWARPRTTQKPSWGDGREAEAGRRVRQGWAGVLSGSFRAGSGPSLHQRRVPPLTHRVSCPAGTVLPKVLLGPTVCSWHCSPLGRAGSGCTQGALVPSAMLSSSCSSAQLAHGPVQSLPLGPRASFLKEGDFHVFFPNWEMCLKKYQDERGDLASCLKPPCFLQAQAWPPASHGYRRGGIHPQTGHTLLPSHKVCQCHPC